MSLDLCCWIVLGEGVLLTGTAFEGLAHPYKENIVKFGNKSVIGNLPEVQQAFKTAEAEAEAKQSA